MSAFTTARTVFVAGFALAALVHPGAHAAPIVTGALVTWPTLTWAGANGVTLVNFGTGAPGAQSTPSPISVAGATIRFNPASGVYSGDVTGQTRSPIRVSDTVATNRNYLNARSNNGEIEIDFGTRILTEFALIWGSVDPTPSTYNVLTFFNGATATGDVVTGTDVNAAIAGITAGRSDAAVAIANLQPFTRVVATATQEAFEFTLANVGGGDPFVIPAPAGLALLGAGVFGLGLVTRRRAAAA